MQSRAVEISVSGEEISTSGEGGGNDVPVWGKGVCSVEVIHISSAEEGLGVDRSSWLWGVAKAMEAWQLLSEVAWQVCVEAVLC